MKLIKFSAFLLTCNLLVSCGTETESFKDLDMTWQEIGQQESDINSLFISGNILFLGSSDGAFKMELNENHNIENIGLALDSAHVSSIVALSTEELLATVRYDMIGHENRVLFSSTNGGDSWDSRPLVISDESEEGHYLDHLVFNSHDGGILFGYNGSVLRSNDLGQTWEKIHSNGSLRFLYVSKSHPNQIWTGGTTNIFSPDVQKSNDGGATWTRLNHEVYFNSDATAYSAAVHPENGQTALIGFNANAVRKSTDGGENWKTVLDDRGRGIMVLKNSDLYSNRVYASGRSPQGQLFVAISDDYGNSWEIETYEESPGDIQTNDMVVTEVNGKETIYFGTNKGVYSLSFE